MTPRSRTTGIVRSLEPMSEVAIGRLDRAGLASAIEWAASEGWNPGVDDLEPFFAADPAGYFGGWVDGELAVTVSAVRYGPEYAFGGFYIASPRHRGQGVAYRVSRAARAYVADCAVVGLDGVLEQEATYASDGFVTAYGTTRYVRDAGDADRAARTGRSGAAVDLVDARTVPIATLATYEVDARTFPVRRDRFLAAWQAMPSAQSWARIGSDGRLRGWGLRRRCREGHKVGPLFADDVETAAAIWRALVAGADGPVFLDVPDPNVEGRALVAREGMTPVFSTRRMYAGGPAPDLALDRVFGVTTLELG